jgi:hypothetical protein
MSQRDAIDEIVEEAERAAAAMPPDPPAHLDGAWQASAVQVRPRRGKSGTPVATAFLVLTAIVVLAGLIFAAFCDQPFVPDDVGALAAAERFVLDRLKAPAGAAFAPFGQAKVTRAADGSYLVTSFVDAENSFGAKLRSHFIAEVAADDDGWRLVSLVFAPQ